MATVSGVEASRLSVIEVLEKHKVDAATGLSSEEVRARQRIHGPNEMEEGEQETLLQKVHSLSHMYMYLLDDRRLSLTHV